MPDAHGQPAGTSAAGAAAGTAPHSAAAAEAMRLDGPGAGGTAADAAHEPAASPGSGRLDAALAATVLAAARTTLLAKMQQVLIGACSRCSVCRLVFTLCCVRCMSCPSNTAHPAALLAACSTGTSVSRGSDCGEIEAFSQKAARRGCVLPQFAQRQRVKSWHCIRAIQFPLVHDAQTERQLAATGCDDVEALSRLTVLLGQQVRTVEGCA